MGHAVRLAQQLVLVAQSCLMLQQAPLQVAEAFIASRGDAEGGRVYGTLAAPTVQQQILQRCWPA